MNDLVDPKRLTQPEGNEDQVQILDHLRTSEQEPGAFLAQWRVPKVLPPRAVPMPALPETCEPERHKRLFAPYL